MRLEVFFLSEYAFDEFFPYRIVVRADETEIHFLICPDRAADAVLVEYGIDVVEPSYGILSRSLIDDTVLAAIERNIQFLGGFDSVVKKYLKEIRAKFLKLAVFLGKCAGHCAWHAVADAHVFVKITRISDMKILWHVLNPVSRLMCKNKRLVAVKIINNIFVNRRQKFFDGCNGIVADAAIENSGRRGIFADYLDSTGR